MLDSLLKQLWEIKERKRKLAEALKEINTQQEYIEQMVINSMRGEGIVKATNEFWGTATVKPEFYPAIEDWVLAVGHIMRTGNIELLKKEINRVVWRENFQERGVLLPGVGAFERDVLLFRRGIGEKNSLDKEMT